MRLSTRTRYSLRILIQLALNTGRALKGRQISADQSISESYLEQIMIPLKSAQFVKTIRGRNGGYILGKDEVEINVLDLMELFEGPIEFADCKDLGESKPCEMMGHCPSTDVWRHLSNTLKDEAAKFNVKDLADKYRSKDIGGYII